MKKTKRVLSMVLALVMVLGLAPVFSLPAKAAGCEEVYLCGIARIGNQDYAPENLMVIFGNKGKRDFPAGFSMTSDTATRRFAGEARMDANQDCTFIITTALNETLAALTQPGSGAQYAVRWQLACQKDHHEWHFHNDYERTYADVYENGSEVPHWGERSSGCYSDERWRYGGAQGNGNCGQSGSGNTKLKWRKLEGVNELKIRLTSDKTCGGCGGEAWAYVYLYIRDNTAPTMSYDFTTNGSTITNSNKSNNSSNNELLIKLGTTNESDPDLRYDKDVSLTKEVRNYVDMKVSFSEPLKVLDAAVGAAVMTQSYTASYIPVDEDTGLPTTQKNQDGSYQKSANPATKTVQDWKDMLDAANTKYNEENNKLPGLQDAIDTAITTYGSPDTAKDFQGTVISSLEAILNNSTVTKTNKGTEESPDYEYGIANKYMNGTAVDYDRLTETLSAGSEAGSAPVGEEGAGAGGQLGTDDKSYINTAASAIITAQENALSQMPDEQKSALQEGAAFPMDGETGTAVMQAAVDALANLVGSTYNSSVTNPKQTQTAQEDGSVTDDDLLTRGIKAVYDWRVATQFTAYTAAKGAYDAQFETVEALKAVVNDRRTVYDAAVSAGRSAASGDSSLGPLITHQLFTNTLGTGYIRMGMPCNLELYRGTTLYQNTAGGAYVKTDFIAAGYDYAGANTDSVEKSGLPDQKDASGSDMLARYSTTLNWRYSAQRGDYFGGDPVPEGGYIENGATGITSLMQKINEAKFYDAAGNPLNLVSSSGNWKNKKDSSDCGVNIFDIADSSGSKRGYDVIVDAEPPTYTRTGNGISPDILTQVVVNKGDYFDFIVSFSEGTYTDRSFGSDYGDEKTYLLLNNGDRAYFANKDSESKVWTFRYQPLQGTKAEETSQLLVIGLCNDKLDGRLATGDGPWGYTDKTNIATYSYYADGRTISDYVGNIMADRANENAQTNTKQIESSTRWADISIDNTAPTFAFSYAPYGSAALKASTKPTDTNAGWGQAARIAVNAIDADIITPKYDPMQTPSSNPSKGIFRPDNATSASSVDSSPTGLFYYVWSQNAAAPKVGEHFEVIKRYSLAGWDATANALMNYTGDLTTVDEDGFISVDVDGTTTVKAKPSTIEAYQDWKELSEKGLTLSMANNGSMIDPPKQALTADGSGAWYLHVWTADMTWDSARQLKQYEMMYARKFNEGYNPTSALNQKMAMIQKRHEDNVKAADGAIKAYVEAHKSEPGMDYGKAWEALKTDYAYSYAKAWEDVRAAYFAEVYTPGYLAKLNASGESNIYSDNAEIKARNATMKEVGYYKNWELKNFNEDDSNWTPQTAQVNFDNQKPTVAVLSEQVSGDGTSSVALPFTVTDAHSGVDYQGTEKGVQFQWVKKPESGEPQVVDANWAHVTGTPTNDSTVYTFTATTAGAAYLNGDGEYYLFILAYDNVGNKVEQKSEKTITINSKGASCAFDQLETAADYYKSVTPTFRITNVHIQEVKYAVTRSTEEPTEYQTDGLTVRESVSNCDKTYQISTLNESRKDGTWYLHVQVQADEGTTHFYHEYRLDNTAPELYLNPNGAVLVKAEASVTITATDALSGVNADTLYYIWTKDDKTAPATDAEGWEKTVSEGIVTKKVETENESGTYYLHIRVEDKLGNANAVTSLGFDLGLEAEETPVAYASGLMTVYQKQADGKFYGIATLELDEPNKTGYRYSFTYDGGETWSSWLPYSSMAELYLPISAASEVTSLADKLQVKFRAPGGTVFQPQSISTADLKLNDQLWAVMTLESLIPRKSGNDLTLLVNRPDGVEIEAITTDTSPDAAVSAQDNTADFKVSHNGVYTFKLKKGESEKQFSIVVDVYDNTEPRAEIRYSKTAPTSENVVATLTTNEPVTVKRIEALNANGETIARKSGSSTYTFEENGSVKFVFADAAGNEGSAIATVTNIDRTPPNVKITVSNTDGGKTYKTVTYGNQTLAQGFFLTVKNADPNGASFRVVSGDLKETLEVTENGTYSFTVMDALGNTVKKSITIGADSTYAIAAPIKAESVSYSYTALPRTLTVSDLGKEQIAAAGGDKTKALTNAQTEENKRAAEKTESLSSYNPGNSFQDAGVTVTITIPAPTDGRKIYLGQFAPIESSKEYETDDLNTMAEAIRNKQTDYFKLENGKYVYTHTYQDNGKTSVWFNDGLGGILEVPINVTGIDTELPTVTPKQETVILKLENGTSCSGAELIARLGGYTATDKETPNDVSVTLCNPDDERTPVIFRSSAPGQYTVRYYVKDGAGHEDFAEQTVYVANADDLFIRADDALLVNNAVNTAILKTNKVKFTVSPQEMQQMFYRGSKAYNRAMRYDVYYTTGLYREGQMKYIAEKLTGEELVNNAYTINFEDTGWYTIIIRNQERSSVYTSFFVSSIAG